jgi:GTPase SAR1 family protein
MAGMDPQTVRATVAQVADDLGWLERHCRQQPDLAPHAGQLRLAAALTRNVVGPALDGTQPVPLHVAVVGGAGAGKSTVVNVLCGAVVAEANPQAGYTRHPSAFLPAAGPDLPAGPGFLGGLQRLAGTVPADRDEDVFQVRRRPAAASDPLGEFVVWDCPDMTTWAAEHYVARLLEVAALADVVVYVASDERYNDAVPTEFLHQLVRAGKAVVVVLTKVSESQAAALVEHFQREVLGKLPAPPGVEFPPVPVVVLPQLPADVRTDPAGKGAAHRVPLLNQLLVLCPSAAAARKRTVANAVQFLQAAGGGLLDVARRDLAEVDRWRSLVADGKAGFERRYQTEFLAGEAFAKFDATKREVLGLLDLQGPGAVLSKGLALLRWPYTAARDFLATSLTRPPAVSRPEREVTAAALAAWVDSLQAETLRRNTGHPVWRLIAARFEAGLPADARERFAEFYRAFERAEATELDEAARRLPDKLRAHPALLNTLRLGSLATDLLAVGLVVALTWPPAWHLLLTIPLAVSLSRQGYEWAVAANVNRDRERVRRHREELLRQHLADPLAAYLADAPLAGGSAVERLQLVLRRVPDGINKISTECGVRSAES